MMHEATAWLYVPLPNSIIEHTLIVITTYDIIFAFASQCFSKVC